MENKTETNHRPAVFFDRDNTLIACDGYLGDPSGVKLVDGAADAVARAKALGYRVVVVSNQSGVARGMFGEDAVHAVNARLDELLQDDRPDAVIDRHEFCAFHPEASIEQYRQDSDLRKPKPGMILRAAEALGIALPDSWLIGDAPRDIEAGRAAGCKTILLKDANLQTSPAANETPTAPPDHVAATLKEAMDLIERATVGSIISPAQVTTETQATPPTQVTTQTSTPATIHTTHPTQAVPAPSNPLSAKPPAPSGDIARLEKLAEQILHELKRRNEQSHTDFSVSKLFAGIVQIVALAALFIAYLNRGVADNHITLLFAIFLQTLTVGLLIMGRQK